MSFLAVACLLSMLLEILLYQGRVRSRISVMIPILPYISPAETALTLHAAEGAACNIKHAAIPFVLSALDTGVISKY